MPSSPGTLWVPLKGFASMTWSTDSESSILHPPDFARLSRFLQHKRTFLNYLVTVLWSMRLHLSHDKCIWLLPRRYGPVSNRKFSNKTTLPVPYDFQMTHRVKQCITNQLSQHYQPQQVPTMTWTVLVTWYTQCKLAPTEILQNFWYILASEIKFRKKMGTWKLNEKKIRKSQESVIE